MNVGMERGLSEVYVSRRAWVSVSRDMTVGGPLFDSVKLMHVLFSSDCSLIRDGGY